jgi:uncharacterized membrane-anchored protein
MQTDHLLRRQLHDELHARPSIYFESPAMVRHEAFFVGSSEPASLPQLLRPADAKVTQVNKSGITPTAAGRIKWEVHGEFVSLTYVVPRPGQNLDPDPEPTWRDVLDAMPGQRIASIEVIVVPQEGADITELLATSDDAVASAIGGRDAEVWSTFRLTSTGTVRMAMLMRNLNAYRTGRMVRRLLEIETYRLMALLGLPLAQEAMLRCQDFDRRLQAIISLVGTDAANQSLILRDLASLSTEVLDYSNRARGRFSATSAYADMVFRRLEELREERVEGHQRLGIFVDRRFRPAVKACEQAQKRVEQTAVQIARASELLRTSVQVDLEQQNALMLVSMERRVRAQVRRQEAVEGFSIVAISYYGLSTLKLLHESLSDTFPAWHVPKAMLMVAAPLIVLAVWWSVRRVHVAIKESK